MSSDLTFVTNEEGQTLKERFEVLIKDSKFFDCLVGYFYSSGFHALYKSLEKTEKIRILIGISTSKNVLDLIETSANPPIDTQNQSKTISLVQDKTFLYSLKSSPDGQLQLKFSHSEAKEKFVDMTIDEFDKSEDSEEVEEGVAKFMEWIKNKKNGNKGISFSEYSRKTLYNDFS
jgi:hypothetical protein